MAVAFRINGYSAPLFDVEPREVFEKPFVADCYSLIFFIEEILEDLATNLDGEGNFCLFFSS